MLQMKINNFIYIGIFTLLFSCSDKEEKSPEIRDYPKYCLFLNLKVGQKLQNVKAKLLLIDDNVIKFKGTCISNNDISGYIYFDFDSIVTGYSSQRKIVITNNFDEIKKNWKECGMDKKKIHQSITQIKDNIQNNIYTKIVIDNNTNNHFKTLHETRVLKDSIILYYSIYPYVINHK